MKIQKDVLSNGVRLITAKVAGVESCTVQVFVGAGSRHEERRTFGLAHFIEHMVFKGTSRYPSAHAISSSADSVGAEINASTSKERTSFYLKVTEEHIKLAFDLLSDMVWNPILDAREIERERGVIVSEIQMYEDLPPNRAYSAFEEVLFAGTALEHDVVGGIGAIREMREIDFRKFREKLYRPERVVVAVAGRWGRSDSDEVEVQRLAEKYFGKVTSNVVTSDSKEKLVTSHESQVTKVKLVTKPIEQAHIFLGFPASPLGDKDRYIEAVLASILGGGMSSRLFSEVRERRGLAYYINTVLQDYTDGGYIGARAGVHLEKVHEAVKIILDQFVSFDQLDQLELAKAREYTKGKFILSLEDTETVSDFIGEDELLEGKPRTVEDVVRGIDKVTKEDVLRVAGRLFDPNKLYLAVVGPYNDTQKFKKILRSQFSILNFH